MYFDGRSIKTEGVICTGVLGFGEWLIKGVVNSSFFTEATIIKKTTTHLINSSLFLTAY